MVNFRKSRAINDPPGSWSIRRLLAGTLSAIVPGSGQPRLSLQTKRHKEAAGQLED
jgi:hypothetical protein